MNIGRNIQDQRRRMNVTQEELAAELGVTAAAVSKWENGYTLPDIMMLCALADYFEVTTDELLGRAREWKYAVIAAENEKLGHQIAALAKQYGIAARSIYTDYQVALAAAREADINVHFMIAGFHTGWYENSGFGSTLVSVHPTDNEILDGFRWIFENYLDKEGRQYIVN